MQALIVLLISIPALVLTQDYGFNILRGNYKITYDQAKAQACCVPDGEVSISTTNNIHEYMNIPKFTGGKCSDFQLTKKQEFLLFDAKEPSWENFDKDGQGQKIVYYSQSYTSPRRGFVSIWVTMKKAQDSLKVVPSADQKSQTVSWTANFAWGFSDTYDGKSNCDIDLTFTKEEPKTCPTTQWKNGDTCTACPTNCLSCKNDKECIRCTTGLGTSSADKLCHTCEEGTFADFYKYSNPPFSPCSSCGNGCKSCEKQNQCKECKPDFVLENNKWCTAVKKAEQGKAEGVKTEGKNQASGETKTGEKGNEEPKGNGWKIAGIVILVIIIVAALGGLAYWLYMKKRAEKLSQSLLSN